MQATKTAPNNTGLFVRRVGPLRSARHRRRARIAYSLTCALLRITMRMNKILSGAIPGFNQSKIGTINRDVCSADMRLVEPRKITPSQTNKGSQYLRKNFIQRSCPKSEIGGVSFASADLHLKSVN